MSNGYIYQHDGHTYRLVPEYTVGKRRIWLVSAEMYTMDNEFVGTWMRYNMPYPLILSLTRYIKEHVVREVKLLPKAYEARTKGKHRS